MIIPGTNNETLGSIDRIYQDYYRDIFWSKLSNEAAENILFNDLWYFSGSNPDLPKDDNIELEIAKIVNSEEYEFLGGTTQGFYGPYIWKSSSRETYDVELPSGIELYTIIMMDGFISRSWLDYISFGNIGALREADNSRPDNSHSMAAYRIINIISQKLFGYEYMKEESAWKEKLDQVKKYALELLEESNKILS